MNVVSRPRLIAFWTKHPNAKQALVGWYDVAKGAEWLSPQDVRNDFNSVDFVQDNRAIFNIGGNNYRLVARISYQYKNLMVRWIGTHAEYDKIDPNTI